MTENTHTTETSQKVIVLISRGLDDECALVAWTMANGFLAQGLEVTVFLVSAGADLVRKGAADLMRMNPLDPSMKELIDSFMDGDGNVWVCPPCASVRGYDQEDLLDGVVITGAPALADLIEAGATSISL